MPTATATAPHTTATNAGTVTRHAPVRTDGPPPVPDEVVPGVDDVDPVARLVEPVAGVSLELYARIVKSIEMVNHDLSLLTPMAAAHGVHHDAWATARREWNVRIADEPAVRALFQVLYGSVAS